jgi:hypothetical protein
MTTEKLDRFVQSSILEQEQTDVGIGLHPALKGESAVPQCMLKKTGWKESQKQNVAVFASNFKGLPFPGATFDPGKRCP